MDSSGAKIGFALWANMYIYSATFSEVYGVDFFPCPDSVLQLDLLEYGIYSFVSVYDIVMVYATIPRPSSLYHSYCYILIDASIFPCYAIHKVIDAILDLFEIRYRRRLLFVGGPSIDDLTGTKSSRDQS